MLCIISSTVLVTDISLSEIPKLLPRWTGRQVSSGTVIVFLQERNKLYTNDSVVGYVRWHDPELDSVVITENIP